MQNSSESENPTAPPSDTREAAVEKNPEEFTLSEVALRLNLLGKLIIPPAPH